MTISFDRLSSKSVQAQQYRKRRRDFRQLFAERLEQRMLLTSVTSVNPPANSHSAQASTDVAATFDQNINSATATPQKFVVHSMQRGQLAGSSAVVSTAGPTVTLNPTSDFFPGELLQASVTSAIQSTGGQPMRMCGSCARQFPLAMARSATAARAWGISGATASAWAMSTATPTATSLSQTTLANNGARHVTGLGLLLGAAVDDEADGQPNADATGDGADEAGVTFPTLTPGTSPALTVVAAVPGTAVLNAWIDFNGDSDWDDAGEKIISDQAVTSGSNSLPAAIPTGAVAGQVFARFRITTDAGHTYSGLARNGEVEDYQVTLVAAKSSARRDGLALPFDLWAAAFATQPSQSTTSLAGPHRQLEESFWKDFEPSVADTVDLQPEEATSAERKTATARARFDSLDEQLVDQVSEEEMDPLVLDTNAGGTI